MQRRRNRRRRRLAVHKDESCGARGRGVGCGALTCSGVCGAPCGPRAAGGQAAGGGAGGGAAAAMMPVQRLICFCRYFLWFTFRRDFTGRSSASLMLLEAESMKLSRSRVASLKSPASPPPPSSPPAAGKQKERRWWGLSSAAGTAMAGGERRRPESPQSPLGCARRAAATAAGKRRRAGKEEEEEGPERGWPRPSPPPCREPGGRAGCTHQPTEPGGNTGSGGAGRASPPGLGHTRPGTDTQPRGTGVHTHTHTPRDRCTGITWPDTRRAGAQHPSDPISLVPPPAAAQLAQNVFLPLGSGPALARLWVRGLGTCSRSDSRQDTHT
uniref:Uncharacterized protein n=1 Tax=Geospiza parvula TaxID=87175 RepID=A0A8C3Q7M7_GEOPR